MNELLKTIVGMLETGRPELQVAAAQVLGELRTKEPAAIKALGASIRRSPVLGRFCLEALAKIQLPEALHLVAAATVDNDLHAEHAAHLLADVGLGAHPVLAELYPTAVGAQRGRLLTILARHLDREAIGVFLRALVVPEVAATAARLLIGASEQFTPALQKQLREGLGKQLGPAMPEDCLVHAISVLAKVDSDGSRQQILGFTAAGVAPAVRSAAYRALRGSKLAATQVRTMMDMLADPEQKEVHDAVRDVLATLPEVPEGLLPVLKTLLQARSPEQRLFALRMLRTASGDDMAKLALKLIAHDDPRFVAAAADALAHNRHAIEPLGRLLATARDPGLQRAAADILIRHGRALPPKFTKNLSEKAARLLATNPRVADLMLDVVLATGGDKLVPFLVERCVRLRRSRRSGDALHVLARLVASNLADDEVRYQLALTKLLQDADRGADRGGADRGGADRVGADRGGADRDGADRGDAEAAPPGNSTMGFFAALARAGFPLLDRLRKESALQPDTLLRLATHFADAVGPERRFATDLLQHLATRTRGRAGDEAKVALRAVSG